MELIDKAALVAELEKRRDRIQKGIFSIPLTGNDKAQATFEYEILGKVRVLLDTLEVKEVDLRKEIDVYFQKNKNGYNGLLICKKNIVPIRKGNFK